MTMHARKNTLFGRLGAALLTSFAVVAMASAAFAGPPTEFVKAKSEKLFTIVNQPVGKARTTALKKEVRELVDYEELAKRSLGKHWEKRTDAEKKQFIKLIEELVELNYADRFKNKASGKKYTVKYTGEKVHPKKPLALVSTAIRYGGDSFDLDYKLLKKEAEGKEVYTIYDVVFDDASLEEGYRAGYVPIIEKEGWGSLIKRMKAKLKELRGR